MIKKFIEIKNIGKFNNCTASGDVELKRLTIICAENGRGKTTLCDILRSLKTGDPKYIIGRKTLGNVDPQSANIRLENSNALFNGVWNSPFQNIEIYDATFVHENVYAGNCVEHEHKKNLYKVIVGAKGVEMAIKVDELDEKIRNAGRDINHNKTAIQRIVPSGLTLDAFIGLKKLTDPDKAIKEKEDELSALSKSEEILRKGTLQKVILPELPTDFQRLVAKSIKDVSEDAEKIVKEHIEHSTNGASKEWIAAGLRYSKDGVCPFCAQPSDTSEMISAYKSYFNQSYAKFKEEIDELGVNVERLFSEAVLLRIEHTVSTNIALAEYWKQYVGIVEPATDVSVIVETVKMYSSVVQKYILAKQRSLLEQIELGDDFWKAQGKIDEIKAIIAAYNSSIEEINKQVAIKKNELKISDLTRVRNETIVLKARKRRFEQDAEELIETYLKANESKGKLEQEKTKVKLELDNYTDTIFVNYEARINKLLENFGAGFRIVETKRSYLGGTASSHYQIKINNVAVDLGDSSSPLNVPSFRNTLSAGDKSTLALTFFIAQLESDSNLSGKVVVFDDPFSSLDRSRRTCTKQIICQIAQKAKQVIVFSHDPHFLKIVWDGSDKAFAKPLQLFRLGQHSTITEWDIEKETREEYHKNYSILTDYCNDSAGDRKKVAMTIRPLLEQYYRFNFPGQFAETEWLGDFIKKIRDAQPGSSLIAAQPILDELDALNDYSKKYHHNTNPSFDKELIDDGELASYAKRALGLVGGL